MRITLFVTNGEMNVREPGSKMSLRVSLRVLKSVNLFYRLIFFQNTFKNHSHTIIAASVCYFICHI